MNLSDLEFICESMANVSGFPIRLFDSGRLSSRFKMHNLDPDPLIIYQDEMMSRNENISYHITPYLQYFGVINYKKFTIIIGPVGQCNLNRQEENDYAFLLGISYSDFKKLLQGMNAIPLIPLENFLHILLLVNFYLNDERLDLTDLPLYDQILQFENHHPFEAVQSEIQNEPNSEAKVFHNSLEYEQQMLAYVTDGNVERLSDFLMKNPPHGVGKVANHYLRQVKNIFITVVTLVSRAAIRGGILEEEAMTLSDYYIQYCEDLFDTNTIGALQYHMIMDFTKKVNKEEDLTSVSPLIKKVIRFVRHHLSNTLNVTLIAEHVHMSRSALSTNFKKEVGITLTSFILNERLEKAKSLLHYTDKSLSEISLFLCFSSQSHFQNVFKKEIGITPNEFRKSIRHK
ncbi:helix-turn-helix domain-containing protein [Oceanobacillus sojae]|uniref:helix-turn-helix domain-containing protein n=1 Tax=Oceanobacillus sojae TaxID=582851 RepID=UPI003633DFC4